MPTKLLHNAINIRVYVSKQEAKDTKRKATDQKKRLLEVQEVLKRAYEEIDYYHLKCTIHILRRLHSKKNRKSH